jgi:formylglycine-generating enzyme required for sulfatase activity
VYISPTRTPTGTATTTPIGYITPTRTITATYNYYWVLTYTPAAYATPPSCYSTGQKWVSPVDGAVQVCVPSGYFYMGSSTSDPEAQSGEQPQHMLYIGSFWIDQTEVTNAQYKKCVDAGRCSAPGSTATSTRSSYYGNSQYNDYPVIAVNWDQARAYCEWAGRRLPTEAEWEKAARSSSARMYPWGSTAPDSSRANFNRDVGDTMKVGSYPLGYSSYGGLDMAGNVWEWTSSMFKAYPYNLSDGREDLASRDKRVVRGGGWESAANMLRSAFHGVSEVTTRAGNYGFRCARSASSSPAATSVVYTPTRTLTRTPTRTPTR